VLEVIEETNGAWKRLMAGKVQPDGLWLGV